MTPRSLAGALAALALSAAGAHGQAVGATPPSEVRTMATAEQSVRPDLATLNLTYTADGKTREAAARAVALRTDSLRRAFEALGIPRDSILTATRTPWARGRIEQVVSAVRYVPTVVDEGRRIEPRAVADTSYRASEALEIRIRDVRKVSAVVDAAIAHGITDVSRLQFVATELAAAQELALREATQRARRQAEAIADAAGVRLGRTILLSTIEQPTRWEGPVVRLSSASDATYTQGTAQSNTQIIESGIPVRMTVQGRWELLPKP